MQKKSLTLSLALLVIAVIQVNAQGFHLGIKGGANISRINNQSFDQGFQFGYNVGAFSEINFTSVIGIQPELMFNQGNYHTGTQFSDLYEHGVSGAKGKLNYLTIPILLSVKPIPFLALQAGPQFGILLNQDQHLVDNGADAFKKGDFSMVVGAQLNLGPLKLGGRYVIGLMDVNNLGNGTATTTETWKDQGFQLYAGLRIF